MFKFQSQSASRFGLAGKENGHSGPPISGGDGRTSVLQITKREERSPSEHGAARLAGGVLEPSHTCCMRTQQPLPLCCLEDHRGKARL